MLLVEGFDDKGNWVKIPMDNAKSLRIFGMGIDQILAIRYYYDLKGGVHPMTAESVKEVMEHDKTPGK